MSALRALRQVVRVSARTRFTPVATRYAVSRPVFANQLSRAFSVSAAKFGSGATDVALSQKLAEELRYEQTENAEASSPDFVQEFLQQGTWTIEDTPGQDEVALVRKFGDEHIRLIFSIADIQADPEDFEAHNEIEGEDIDDSAASYPLRTSLTITKSNAPGSLNIDMIAQEGHFMVENVSFYDDAKLGTELTAEADWKRRGMYIGPQFNTLDALLQEQFEKFLDERGINETVAHFIPEYAEFKEQKEYVKWLGKVKSFVDA
ncbi:regulatory protein suaprga1 [Coprinopsis cinerea okayama7|uniref:Regulatory protein suaprga1 n=1 Tax=Coprinopsis cinerea (strain Okayama-7 / 130 / ATCC MYA-4618 / FGSC 9003) TaxID=240176 RepID=A8NB57_COPC7|nr:regulatory protein suaprga1 [Coprinopsis cinerea okayama7\|eukprot:XP_001832058.2 regulatory protein suaprga1 [Coprinopsis cinerea okayama7\